MTHPMSKHMREIAADPDTMPCDAENCTEWADELDRLHARIAELEAERRIDAKTHGWQRARIAELEAENKQLSLEAYRGKEGGYDDE